MIVSTPAASARPVLQMKDSTLGIERKTMLIPVEPHGHAYFEIVILAKGSLRHHLEIENAEHYCVQTAGDVFVLSPGEAHWYEYDREQKMEYYDLFISPIVFSEMLQVVHNNSGFNTLALQDDFVYHKKGFFALHVDPENFDQIKTLCAVALREYTHISAGTPLILRSLFTAILALLCRHWAKVTSDDACLDANSNGKIVMRALAYIETHYAEPISVDALAKSLFVSTDCFRKAFKKITGMSPVKYINNLRIRHAMDLLHNSSLNVSKVASLTGFSDINHFTRCFTRANRMLPSVFRKEALKENERTLNSGG